MPLNRGFRRRGALWTFLIAALAAALLTGCDIGKPSGPLPTVVLGDASAPAPTAASQKRAASTGIVASGEIAPAEQAEPALAIGGRIAALHVAEGDVVAVGDLLAELDMAALQAQIAGAQAAVDAAQAGRELLLAGATDESVRAAQAAVDAAQAGLDALRVQPRTEAVVQAEANLATAQAARDLLLNGATALEREQARLTVEGAKAALWAAQSARDATCGSRALAEAQCDSAEAQVAVAQAALSQAEVAQRQLAAGARREVIAQAREAVRIAEAQLALTQAPLLVQDVVAAQAAVDGARAQLDALQAPPQAARLAQADANIAAAQAGLDAALAQAAAMRLTAPIAGTVTELYAHAGGFAQPGAPLLALADLANLRVETTDLSERDVPGVTVGAAVEVIVEALGETVPGKVIEIAPHAEELGGDVVYRVTIALDALPEGARAGMTVEVRF